MRGLMFTIAGLLTGYIISNLKFNSFEDIMEDLIKKTSRWIDSIKDFLIETVIGIEGFDSDAIKINVDAFINELSKIVDEISTIDDFNEKIVFVEDSMIKITADLLKQESNKKVLDK